MKKATYQRILTANAVESSFQQKMPKKIRINPLLLFRFTRMPFGLKMGRHIFSSCGRPVHKIQVAVMPLSF